MKQVSKTRLVAIVSALILNGVFIGVLGYAWIEQQKQIEMAQAKKPPPLPVRLENVEHNEGESPTIDVDELARTAEREQRRLERIPEAKRVDAFEKNADWLERNSNEAAVQAIIDTIRPAFKRPNRAYAPAADPPAGRFDSDSGIPFETKKVVDDKGVERFEHTLVDKEGRSMVYLTRREQNAEGKNVVYYGTYQNDGTVYESGQPDTETGTFTALLERVGSSPVLNKIFKEIVQPGLAAEQEKRLDK